MSRTYKTAAGWWAAMEDRHEAMSEEEREAWYRTQEGGVYLGLLQGSWREDWEEDVERGFQRLYGEG